MIYYVGFYGCEDDASCRVASAAAVDKMNYIAEKLAKYDVVKIVSASHTTIAGKFFRGRIKNIGKNISLKTFSSVGWTLPNFWKIEVFFKCVQLLLYLVVHCSKDCNVVVYHSLYIMWPIVLAHKIKKFNLILEVEEIYQDVVDIPVKKKMSEYKTFSQADAYFFSTEYLEKKLNRGNKPYCIVYGNYNVCHKHHQERENNIIHVVFGGNLEESKGGLLAAKSSIFLEEDFFLHIAGNGPTEDVLKIKAALRDINNDKKSNCACFEGELISLDYEMLLQRCSIGLCSQDPSAKYSETSFPSKVLNYLRHGLRVVSIRIPTIEKSQISSAIYFYDDNTPQALALAIKTAAQCPNNGILLLQQLDREFETKLQTVILGGK